MALSESTNIISFNSLFEKVGQFNLKGKTFLIPEMNKIACHLVAGTFRGFGINAQVLETYTGLDIGKEFTSGKECYPCQVTVGDLLFFMEKEKDRRGDDFDPEDYIYFMPEATGPCRFGMYNKYQRIVLDSFPELRKLKIGSLTTGNSYSLEGMLDEEEAKVFRKVAYCSVVMSDVLDRLLWRIRPYEKESGLADAFIEKAMLKMADAFEHYGTQKKLNRILDQLEKIIIAGKSIIDPKITSKPLIGIVGEIYLRTHVQSNQDLVRKLEKYGAEVVVASISEWVDFTAYENLRLAKTSLNENLKQFRIHRIRDDLKNILHYRLTLAYQNAKQKQVYKRVNSHMHLHIPHQVSHLEKTLLDKDLFSFDIGTEACLSISGLMEYVREGYNGVLNVYPFTCMPGTITSAIVKPAMNKLMIPYLDAPYDGTYLPGWEANLRTFMYQAKQHFLRNMRKDYISG